MLRERLLIQQPVRVVDRLQADQEYQGMGIRQLHALGQRLWLDNISRELLDSGTLERYIRECSITGLTSNPSIFDAAIAGSTAYDPDIRMQTRAGVSGEDLIYRLALDDLRRAADLFRPLFDHSDGLDGWVSMEIAPQFADDAEGSIEATRLVHRLAERPNLLVKIPGTPAGSTAIEASIAAGIPVNVTLLFSKAHYLAAAEAYLRGLERRLQTRLDLRVDSVASIFISRWDVAAADLAPSALRGQLGTAMGGRIYAAYRELLASPRWRRLADAGARPQRLLWASTGNKDPDTSPTRYVEALAAPDTINTLPEKTLLALIDKRTGEVPPLTVMPEDGNAAERCLARFQEAGIDVDAFARQLQDAGVRSFKSSWQSLLDRIAGKAMAPAGDRRA